MTSRRRRTKRWVMRFERRLPLSIEPLIGWTSDDDPMADVELEFKSLKSAIEFVERQGLNYRVPSHVMHEETPWQTVKSRGTWKTGLKTRGTRDQHNLARRAIRLN